MNLETHGCGQDSIDCRQLTVDIVSDESDDSMCLELRSDLHKQNPEIEFLVNGMLGLVSKMFTEAM